MGFKRPLDCEDFQELLSFKQARQVVYGNKMAQCRDLHRTSSQETGVTDDHEESFSKSLQRETFGNNSVSEASNIAKDFGTSVSQSLVTSNSPDYDVGSRLGAFSSDFSEHSEFDFSWKLEAFEDAYTSYLDSSPRKQVPLGPNHQASIPMWVKHSGVDKNQLEWEENFMGTCVIPMPDRESSADISDKAGSTCKDCSCADEGSVRCVRQHILEARESLRKSLGHEKLLNLGFYEMGEELANKWTKEEERVFHAIVNSNPASLGQNFWNHLSHVFYTRSTKEIVSYYFNVFMLRRRAAQNRSNLLDIDSDDDELPGFNRGFHRARVLDVDDDSDIESIDQHDHADHGEDTLIEDGEDDDEDDDDNDGDGDLGESSEGGTGEDSGVDNVSETHDMKPFDGSRFEAVKHFDDKVGEDFAVQDDSCMSFEFQVDTVDSCDPVDASVTLQSSQATSDNRECFPVNGDGYNDGVDQAYFLDSCGAKAWDTHYTDPIKGVDFLPTCNMIEEIFGQGSSSDKK